MVLNYNDDDHDDDDDDDAFFDSFPLRVMYFDDVLNSIFLYFFIITGVIIIIAGNA